MSSSPASGTVSGGQTTVTSTATDANGNSATCSFTVTVNDAQRGDHLFEQSGGERGGGGVFEHVTFVVTATTTVRGDDVEQSSERKQFPGGTTTVTSTATDAHGNSARAVSR